MQRGRSVPQKAPCSIVLHYVRTFARPDHDAEFSAKKPNLRALESTACGKLGPRGPRKLERSPFTKSLGNMLSSVAPGASTSVGKISKFTNQSRDI